MCDDCNFPVSEIDTDAETNMILELLGGNLVEQVSKLHQAFDQLDKAHMMAALAMKGLDPDSPQAKLLGHSLEYLDGVRAALSSRG